MINITDKFLKEIYFLQLDDTCETTMEQLKKILLDYFGVTIYGSYLQSDKLFKLINNSLDTSKVSKIIGSNTYTSVYNSALINGISAHSADFDDGSNSGIIHLGSPIISAIFSLTESKNISYKDFLRGIVVGYEAALRLARAIQPAHKKNGFHASATCGSIGAAVGVSAALNLDYDTMKNGFSAAIVSAGGLLKVLEDDSELKPFNVGRASLVAVLSVNMAIAGFKGPKDALSGDNGFFRVFSGEDNPDFLHKRDKKDLAINNIYFKPYPACRYTHPAIEAAISLNKKSKYSVDEIDMIKVSTYFWAVKNHDHIIINSANSARMSTPYNVAIALKFGFVTINEYSNEVINHPDIKELMKKIIVISSDSYTKEFPEQSIAEVEVFLKNGECHREIVNVPKGEPENPLTVGEIENKFISLTRAAGKDDHMIQQLIHSVWNLETEYEKLLSLL